MLKKFLIILVLGTIANCKGISSTKSFSSYDVNSKGNRVRKTFTGPMVVFNSIQFGESIDTKDKLHELLKINECKDLKNIEVEFYNDYILIAGYQKMVISADCSREEAAK